MSTKWFQLLRHYISVCPLLLPLSFSWIPSGTSLSFITIGRHLCKPKQVGFIQEGNLLLVLRVIYLPAHPYLPPLPLARHPRPYTITVCPSLSLFLFLLSKKKFFLRRNGRNVDVCVTLDWRQFTFCHELGTVYVVLPQAFCSIALCLNNKAPRETQ